MLSSAIAAPTVYPKGNKTPYQSGMRKWTAPARCKPIALAEAARAGSKLQQAPGFARAQLTALKIGITQTAHASITATNAEATVASGPPSISTRFLAMPDHNVSQPVYIRVEISCWPS